MMHESTPEIEAILAELTKLCCQALQADGMFIQQRVDQLTKSLSTNGWEQHRQGKEPLSVVLEQRVRESCQEPASHRGAALKSVVSEVEKSYLSQSRYVASTPDDVSDEEA